ncbi:MAG: alpha-hydroxy-acid oxidizing protein, partial [Candidatus Eremiobacteraeota bacterium]|nr:alpha-hydroxy-acid oxidizing protein [Candidatus Eremiobacteraeota bacterium]
CAMEDVKAASCGHIWYQLYLLGGRECAARAIERAKHAGVSALVVTIDTAVAGLRERDLRNGSRELLTRRWWTMLPHVAQVLTRPAWLAGLLRDGGLMRLPNVVLPDSGPMAYADIGAALEQSTVSWADFRWIRDVWGDRPLVVKGVLDADDARRAVDAGADAIVVSNHGGRQLDGVVATLRALTEIVTAAGSQTQVLLDGGIRRGSDIVKAMCLGARGVLIGRAYAYGLGAAGPAGVARALEILRTDIVRTLRLLGCHDVGALNESYVRVPSDWKTVC